MSVDENEAGPNAHLMPNPIDRRREPRFPCAGEARIIDCETGLDLGEGLISDISASGASVHVYCRLKPGSLIELRQGDHRYRGEIRYCVEAAPDFRLGVQLIPPNQWSPNKDWPALRMAE